MAESCYRCGKPATIKLPRMRVNLCSYCAAVAASELSVAIPILDKPVKKRNKRKTRYTAIVSAVMVFILLLLGTAVLTIHHDGWNFFVQRSAGVGSTSDDNGPPEHPSPSQTPTRIK